MPAASRTHPELIGRPWRAGRRIAHFHLRSAALTPNLENGLAHSADSDIHPATKEWPDSPKRFRRYDRAVISAIVLAAGKSTRMGRAKANLPLGTNDTFLSRIVHTFRAADVEDVLIVVGHDADQILDAFARTGARARFVTNPQYEDGQLSSFICGLNAVDQPDVEATLMTLVDVPLVTPRTVRAVIERWLDTRAPIVRPVSGAEHGHPILIARSLFDAIRHSDPAIGAKAVIRAYASAAGDVDVDDPGAFLDFDTDADYRHLREAGGPDAE
jgi:molybdenum cofactor cytidylyltransferase